MENSAKFVQFANVSDYIGTGAIHVPVFESEILDLVKKRGVLAQRIAAKLATGHPTRYFEKTARQATAKMEDPRNIAATAGGPTRVERSANIKAVVNAINFGMFDREVTQDQGLFTSLQGEDLQGMITDMLTLQDDKVWNGAAASLVAADEDYCGLLTQITRTATVANGVTIAATIRTEVAKLAAFKDYDVKPSAIYMNPMTIDIMEQEEIALGDKEKQYEVEVLPGIRVKGVMTVMGVLPVIADPFLAVIDDGAGHDLHKIAVVSENLLERRYIGSPVPRVFQLGRQGDLVERYVGVQFDTFIAKAAAKGHVVITKSVNQA